MSKNELVEQLIEECLVNLSQIVHDGMKSNNKEVKDAVRPMLHEFNDIWECVNKIREEEEKE